MEIGSYGDRELWNGAVDRYRPRGRVDSDLGKRWVMGVESCIRERESFIRKNENRKWVPRERERASSEKKK